jgi:hypothetical protein
MADGPEVTVNDWVTWPLLYLAHNIKPTRVIREGFFPGPQESKAYPSIERLRTS